MTDSAQFAEPVAEPATGAATEGAGVGVGEELAAARVALGLSIADIARQLKFGARQIDAMEQGRFEDLPSGTFARGMVRSYARLLKLDSEALVGRMAARVAVPDNAEAVASARQPIPITDSNRRVNLVYAALSVAILGVIAAVVVEWQRERTDAAKLSFVAAAQAPAEPKQLASATAVDVSATNIMTPPAADPVAPLAAPAPPSAVPPPTAQGNRRIALKFDGISWVEIRGRDGKVLLSELNPAGSERTVEGRPPFALIIGNAQQVRLSYEDRQIDLAPHVKVEVARFTLE